MWMMKLGYTWSKTVLEDVIVMKILNLLLVVATCFFLLLIAFDADAPSATADPNPMKQNQDQFTRMQPTYYAETSK
jgi:hypothetical protein